MLLHSCTLGNLLVRALKFVWCLDNSTDNQVISGHSLSEYQRTIRRMYLILGKKEACRIFDTNRLNKMLWFTWLHVGKFA